MAGADVGATLGVRIAQLATRIREDSTARTTVPVVRLASQVADAMASARAETVRKGLVDWLGAKGVDVPADGELSGLLGFVTKAGGWLAQNVIGTAIGFGIGQSLSAVLNPYFTDLVQSAWRSHPNAVLSPGELAVAVLKGYLTQGEAAAEATESGINPERFQTMVDTVGNPPGVETVLLLWRRGVVSDEDLAKAVRQSNIRPEWLPVVQALGVQWPSWSEFLDAYLEGQVEEGEARELYARAGGDPELFELLFNTRGQAPTPAQLQDMANRGLIAWDGRGPGETTFEQGFLEGPWRNKWLEPFKAAAIYRPPPRTVVAMLRSAAIDATRATELLLNYGLSDVDAAAMIAEAQNNATEADRDLTKSEVLALYEQRFLETAQAQQLLGSLGYGADQIGMLLALTDSKRLRAYRDRLVATVRARYVARKIEELDVVTALDGLGVPNDARDQWLDLWTQEREATTADLTLAQWQAAVKRGIVAEADFRTEMTRRGYSPFEVDVLWALTAPAPTGG